MKRFVCPIATLAFFSIMVAASCTLPRDTPNPTPVIDGMQACVDACTIQAERCEQPKDCAGFCEDLFKNSSAHCEDELTAQWACTLPGYLAQSECPYPSYECLLLKSAADVCVADFGCTTFDWSNNQWVFASSCWSGAFGPNNEESCACDQRCKRVEYRSKCWMQGTTSTCECYVEGVLQGRCDNGAAPLCGHVYEGCCNQYYRIKLYGG